MPTYGYYTLVHSDAQLRALADEMKANARQYPLDPDNVGGYLRDEPGQKERIGPMVRVHGPEGGEFTKRYSRFITFSATSVRPLQISYVEYGVKEEAGVIRQLVIANNNLEPLLPQDVARIGHFFLDMKEAYSPVETPPHVALLFNRRSTHEQA